LPTDAVIINNTNLVKVGSTEDILDMLCYDVILCSIHTVDVDPLNLCLTITVTVQGGSKTMQNF